MNRICDMGYQDLGASDHLFNAFVELHKASREFKKLKEEENLPL